MKPALRPATAADLPFLWEMLYEAAYWDPTGVRPPTEAFLADDHNVRYLEGWARAGDFGVIAASPSGERIGAAWARRFPATRAAWGYVDEATPELGFAVRAGYRGQGVGAALLSALIETARAAGVPALSLSVAAANPARRLYSRTGFIEYATSGGSITMLLTVP